MSDEKRDPNTLEENEIHDHHHDHEHNHDHDEHDHEHMATVVMENEDGTTEEYPVVDEFEYDGAIYVLVENEDGTVTPLRQSDEEGELEFLTEEEFDNVASAYNEFMDEYGDEEWDEDDDDTDWDDEDQGLEDEEDEHHVE